ncbi:response regulator [Succinispira mobilis]|uniref:response regulator n=1 Tax=Succinispira mobilis TaxID=78120 RepID=UPI0003642E22|nr:response regulator [Succinispira mobilis]
MKILVVDDEDNIRELLRFTLEKNTFNVREASDGEQALKILTEYLPDLILLDLMLPKIDGLEVCRRIKNNPATAGIPIIMLTARAEEIDKILGLELGADDYITKPFSPREVIARVKAVLRRLGNSNVNEGELVLGDLKINFISYEVHILDEKIELTPKEYELLKLFATNLGRVFSREQLLEKIWGYEYYGDTRTVDVHIRHLRSKLEKSKQLTNAIETVRGVGYRFADNN